MLKALGTAAAAAAVLAVGVPLLAHHSFAAEYDEAKPVTLSGSVTRLDWNNPHVTLQLAVTAADGTIETWRIEAGPPNQVQGNKVSREMLTAGTRVVIGGYLARDGRKAAWGRDVTFADGRTFMLVRRQDDPRDSLFLRERPGRPATFAERVDAALPYGLYGVPALVLAIGIWKLRRQKKKEGVSTP